MASRVDTLLVVGLAVCLLGCVQHAAAGPLWDYANAPDPTFGWVDTGYRLNNSVRAGRCAFSKHAGCGYR